MKYYVYYFDGALKKPMYDQLVLDCKSFKSALTRANALIRTLPYYKNCRILCIKEANFDNSLFNF